MELYEKALQLAVNAHKGQSRKHNDTPYIAHPIMVARLLEQHSFNETVVAAALVHDVLEDTDVDAATIRDTLGSDVLAIVQAVSEETHLEWEERKEAYVRSVVVASEAVWALSVADKIHNASEFLAYHEKVGPQSWTIFNRGKEKKLWFETLLHSELTKVWQHPLLDIYQEKLIALETLPD